MCGGWEVYVNYVDHLTFKYKAFHLLIDETCNIKQKRSEWLKKVGKGLPALLPPVLPSPGALGSQPCLKPC